MTERHPNVLVFITDQQRYDHVGCTGNPVLRTPNIDRIAQSGVQFARHYVNNPLCQPARATLFTGQTSRGHGVRTNGIPLDPGIPTITQALLDAGYRTHSSGKLHLQNYFAPRGLTTDPSTQQVDPRVDLERRDLWCAGRIQELPSPYYGLESTDFIGFHGDGTFGEYLHWLERDHPEAVPLLSRERARVPPTGADQSWKSALPPDLHFTTWIANRTIAFLQDHDQDDRPFFLWSSFTDPHHPYCPPAPYDELYDPASVPMPTRGEGELDNLAPFFRRIYEQDVQVSGRGDATRASEAHIREIIAHTFGMIGLIDDNVGRVLDALEEEALRENTVVVFMSDHGDMLGDHWLLNKGPFHFEGLLHVPLVVSWPGHFPQGVRTTALTSHLDFAPTILDLCGVSIPEGRRPPEPEAPHAPPPWPGHSLVPILNEQATSVRGAAVVENDEDYLGLRLRTLITDRWKLTTYAGQQFGELFDLGEDPDELHNRWSDPAYQGLRDDLRLSLLDELVLTDSALPRRLAHA